MGEAKNDFLIAAGGLAILAVLDGETASDISQAAGGAFSYNIKMRWLLIQFILLYRVTLGRLIGGQCRYLPTCSQYAIDAINKYGPWRGSWRAVKRICRCHPWGGQGYDPA